MKQAGLVGTSGVRVELVLPVVDGHGTDREEHQQSQQTFQESPSGILRVIGNPGHEARANANFMRESQPAALYATRRCSASPGWTGVDVAGGSNLHRARDAG